MVAFKVAFCKKMSSFFGTPTLSIKALGLIFDKLECFVYQNSKKTFFNCTNLFISFPNLTILPFRKYFFNKTYTNPSHEATEFAGKVSIHFFSESFNVKRIKCNWIISWCIFRSCIIKLASSNSLRNRKASQSLKIWIAWSYILHQKQITHSHQYLRISSKIY